jgi:hypothetical protein
VLHALIKQNVRTPDAVLRDLAAQVAIGQSASERLMAMCQRYRLIDIEGLSDKIISRSEAATRAAIGKLKRGTFHGQSRFDVPGGEIVASKAAVTIDPDAGEILVDFTGSSPQTRSGINVVLNYTHAYSAFAIRSCLNPQPPNNAELETDQSPRARRFDPRLLVSGAGRGPPRCRYVCADTDSQGAPSCHTGSRARRRVLARCGQCKFKASALMGGPSHRRC